MDRVILNQHCQSQHHVDRSAGPDSELTDLGRRQAACLGSRLERELGTAPCRLYTSDLRRAAQTAKFVADAIGLAAIRVVELREWGCPAPADLQPGPIASPGDERLRFLFDTRPAPHIETWREFHARVSGFMDHLAGQLDPGRLPVVVTHGGTLSNIVVRWLGLPLDALPERTPFAASPGSISILRRNEHGNPVIERLNDRTHLYQADLADGGDLRG